MARHPGLDVGEVASRMLATRVDSEAAGWAVVVEAGTRLDLSRPLQPTGWAPGAPEIGSRLSLIMLISLGCDDIEPQRVAREVSRYG